MNCQKKAWNRMHEENPAPPVSSSRIRRSQVSIQILYSHGWRATSELCLNLWAQNTKFCTRIANISTPKCYNLILLEPPKDSASESTFEAIPPQSWPPQVLHPPTFLSFQVALENVQFRVCVVGYGSRVGQHPEVH